MLHFFFLAFKFCVMLVRLFLTQACKTIPIFSFGIFSNLILFYKEIFNLFGIYFGGGACSRNFQIQKDTRENISTMVTLFIISEKRLF